ncbi:MAG: LysM peptidoglycan-binding domain-containing protein [Rhodothermales bacterium]|nr:LysM peptidoglycan-binding domain-containing protein [Rhodothermales bacterium]
MRFLRLFASCCLVFLFAVSVGFAQAPASSYTVKKGDTMYSIARMHEMTVDELRSLNNLSGTAIQAGQTLRVRAPLTGPRPTLTEPTRPRPNDPVPPPASQNASASGAAQPAVSYTSTSRGKRSYTVQPGDTYYSIGVAMGVPAYAIFALNEGDGSPLAPNATIWVPEVPTRASDGQAQTYRVRRGDTMFSIAREHQVTVADLRQANGIDGSQLGIDQVIKIPRPQLNASRAPQPLPPLYEQGPVDIYPDTFAGRVLTSGRPYDPTRFTISHPDLPMESIVLLTNAATGMSTFAEVSDRGPADTRFIIDISSAVARELGLSVGSRDPIQLRVVE